MKEFGLRLRELRESKNTTQKQLGTYLSVSGNTIHSWETDKQEPSLSMLLSIADYFGVSLDYLLGRTEY